MWKSDEKYIAITDIINNIHLDDHVLFNGDEYAISYVDNIAYQNEAMFIGLRAIK